ncbi:MAG TPA: DUF2461 domain-containing protein [Candidatus Binatia bacterium]|jgi:uncharacterized protein (TIGR02453 family)
MATRTIAPPARFAGFADRDASFFRALARNQKRDWFLAHKDEYDRGWLGPMKALLAEVRIRLEPLYGHDPLAEPKVFRIYRDVRFSKDKVPYKTHIGGFLPLGGTGNGPSAAAALYVHVGADEVFVAAGQYMMDGDQLRRFRAALLDARGVKLAKTLAPLTRAGYEIGSHDTLQRVPRGIDPEHPRAALLKRKGLILAFPGLPREKLTSRALVSWLIAHAKRTVPVVEWLAALT